MKTNLDKKEIAIKLRKNGKSIRDIENTLNIPRSTLSGWLHNIKLSKKQKERLHKKWLVALVKARAKASEVHKRNRLERMRKIEYGVKEFTSDIIIDRKLGEIIFSIFYLAEGAKKHKGKIEISNTDPEILTAFLELFRYLYSPKESRLRCYLHLRMDQSEKATENYWSRILHVPKSQFVKTQVDERTIEPTFKNYKGVCSVYYCDTNLHKRVMTIGKELIKIISDDLQKGA